MPWEGNGFCHRLFAVRAIGDDEGKFGMDLLELRKTPLSGIRFAALLFCAISIYYRFGTQGDYLVELRMDQRRLDDLVGELKRVADKKDCRYGRI
jgi:hypothetical protein